MPSSYNGWPASPNPDAIGINRGWEPIKGHDFPGGIKRGDVETVFTYLVRQLNARVEPIAEYPPGDEWGYAYRDNVNNPGQLSCHASGTAIDYNATQHPNRQAYTWTQAQVREIHEILDECSGVIRWLEGYDEMHFEIRGTAAQVAEAAAKLRALPTITQESQMILLQRKSKAEQCMLAMVIGGKVKLIETHGSVSPNKIDDQTWTWLIRTYGITDTPD